MPCTTPSIYQIFSSPIGDLWICQTGNALTGLTIGPPGDSTGLCRDQTPLLTETARQLSAYFGGRLHQFDLPLDPAGTPFRKKVWQALRTIPYGQTRTYKELALQVDSPRAFRAVGQANHFNPIMILIPCHRVIGADGRLTGYAYGTGVKQFLLDLERRHS